MSVCSRCGSQLEEGNASCPACGYDLYASEPGQGPLAPKPESRALTYVLLVLALLGAGVYALTRSASFTGRPDTRITLEAQTSQLPPGEKWDASKEQATVRVLTRRLKDMGIMANVTSSGRTFAVELPGMANRPEVIDQLTAWGRLEFRYLKNVRNERHRNAPYTLDLETNEDGSEKYVFKDEAGNEVPLRDVLAESPIVLTGDDLKSNAEAQKSEQLQQIYVAIEFTEAGRKTFADFTRAHVSEYLAIILNGRIISAPVIRDAILDGKAIIEGGFPNLEEAEGLAKLLGSGALPVPLDVVKNEKI